MVDLSSWGIFLNSGVCNTYLAVLSSMSTLLLHHHEGSMRNVMPHIKVNGQQGKLRFILIRGSLRFEAATLVT